MTIGVPPPGHSGLTPLSGESMGSGLARETDRAGGPDFASLIEAPDHSRRDPEPAAAFDALGVFGRFAIAPGAMAAPEAWALLDPAAPGAAVVGMAVPSPVALPPGLIPESSAGTDARLAAGSEAGRGAMPIAVAPEAAAAIAAAPSIGLPRAAEESGPDRAESSGRLPSRLLPDAGPQPVSAAVALENGTIQVILRSDDPGMDHGALLRHRIEELARELDLSIDGVRLNGVALPTAAAGAAHGRRTN